MIEISKLRFVYFEISTMSESQVCAFKGTEFIKLGKVTRFRRFAPPCVMGTLAFQIKLES